jgi:hypothetical protein
MTDADMEQVAREMEQRRAAAQGKRTAQQRRAVVQSPRPPAPRPERAGYKPFKRQTAVQFFRHGEWQAGVIVEVHYDPSRKPGIGRVSYEVKFHPAYHPVKVAAKDVEVAVAGSGLVPAVDLTARRTA